MPHSGCGGFLPTEVRGTAMGKKLRVLIVEDSEDDTLLVLRELRRGGYDPSHKRVETPEDMRAALEEEPWDLVISDYAMPMFDAPRALGVLGESGRDIPFIVLSGSTGEETAVETMKAGAHDYVKKDNIARLLPSVERELREAEARRESRRAEEALKASELTYREIFNAANDAIFVHDMQTGAILDVNEKMLEMFGYSRDEAIALDVEDYSSGVFPYTQAEAVWWVRRAAEGAPQLFEWRARDKSGRLFWVEVNLKHASIGGVDRVLAVVRDITGRKRMEEELRKSQAMYRELYSGAPVPYLSIDIEGRVMECNRAVESFTGYTTRELLGMKVPELYAPESRDKAKRLFERSKSGEGFENQEMVYLRKDGGRVFGLLSVNPLLDDQGRVVASRSVILDITERRRMEDWLMELNRCLLGLGSDIITNIESIIRAAKGILSADVVQYARLDRGRLSLLSTLGGEEAFVVTDGPEAHICYRVLSGESGAPLEIEDLRECGYEGSHPDIVKHGLVSYLGYPVGLGGAAMGCLSIYTGQKRTFTHEEKDLLGTLAQAVSIEEERLAREEGLKDFIDIASHELRHPITVIKGYTNTLLSYGHRFDRERTAEILGYLDAGSDRLTRLVEELLDVSRIERGSFTIDRREMELRSLLELALAEMAARAFDNEIVLRMPADLGVVEADPDKLTELLLILLDNALKFSQPGAVVEVEAERGDGEVAVSVADRGPGIPEEDRERVFERFFQVGEAHHHSVPGIGLGLYIARQIVEIHGGRIWCEPREGGGSVFRFTLPRA